VDEESIEALERELPGLKALGRFARTLERIPWFSNLGEPLSAGARAAAETYAQRLGFPQADIAILVDWDDAAAAAESMDWQSEWWEAEELLRSDLTGRAMEILSEDALRFGMALIADKVSEPAREGMEQAAVIFDADDEASQNLAVGAAVQAAHGAALALLAAQDPQFEIETHAFTAKFQLFEFGRWPVAITGSSSICFRSAANQLQSSRDQQVCRNNGQHPFESLSKNRLRHTPQKACAEPGPGESEAKYGC
jgi:hypothetical protein